ncbi:HPr kinase/phosphorylase [Rubellimicrobium roseum]|uniref:HPr kinase/phosphorylase C-terminal domain-containing protein n=1 Tax=Rubellimicrobium roseum TaxID=687525 RepID=A0A5C4NN43_9RHOB|nr:HPr kinase/phosphatase C-terminal domain-containing protein [Rubellimicrobium roseum]TNC74077.1 hypothetical protein FHG71_02435 [Rubellimicrobium roseum]
MTLVVHATTVAWRGRGVLIRGASGAGKSSLGLELMAGGCRLVADDRTELRAEDGRLLARCPPAIRGLIEARGVGLLAARSLEEAPVRLIVDLDRTETERLPPWRGEAVLGVTLPCLHKPATGHFAAAVLQYLKAGRIEPAAPRFP